MLNRSGNTTDNLCFRYRFRDVFSRFRCCVYNGTGPLLRKHNGNMELHVSATFPFTDSCNFVLWQVWLQSLVARLNWLNDFCQRSLSADDIFIAGISLNDLTEQEKLPSLRCVNNHFLFYRSVFSLTLLFHGFASRHAVNNTHEQGVKIQLINFYYFNYPITGRSHSCI